LLDQKCQGPLSAWPWSFLTQLYSSSWNLPLRDHKTIEQYFSTITSHNTWQNVPPHTKAVVLVELKSNCAVLWNISGLSLWKELQHTINTRCFLCIWKQVTLMLSATEYTCTVTSQLFISSLFGLHNPNPPNWNHDTWESNIKSLS
jgi:hypothetical protein